MRTFIGRKHLVRLALAASFAGGATLVLMAWLDTSNIAVWSALLSFCR